MKVQFLKVMRQMLITCCLFLILAPYATASMIGFELEIANPGVSIFRLKNTSASAEITALSFFIGDSGYNIDVVSGFLSMIDTGSTLSESLVVGDSVQGADNDPTGRFDNIAFSFSGFDVGDRFQFQTDIDKDNLNTNEVFDSVFFNNGSAANAIMSVSFFDGLERGTIDLTLPDSTGNAPYIFNAAGVTNPVPEPATVILFGIGLLGLAGVNRKK